MNKITLAILITVASVINATAAESMFCLSTKDNSIVLEAENGNNVYIWHYGKKLSEKEIGQLPSSGLKKHLAYPFHGNQSYKEEALSIVQPDGRLGLNLLVKNVNKTSWEDGEILEITCHDDIYPIEVKMLYKSYREENVIEAWTEITNEGKKSVTLLRYDSASLPIRVGDVWMTHFYGAWGAEGSICSEPLTREMKVVKSRDGVRAAARQRAEVIFSLDGKPQENTGRTIGAALCWSGNFELRADTSDSDYHTFFAGINPVNANYTLGAKKTFVTPPLALSYSSEGMGGISRNFHRWGRNYKIFNGNKPKMVLLNSWEGVHFEIKQDEMDEMISDAAALGGELFVMDDGWFGDGKYHRDNDKAALGDWTVDKRKLPGGIGHLVQQAQAKGIKFGIWIEPEMVNTASELYEKHPDWIIRQAGREPALGRGGNQTVLDLSNPKVQDFVFKVVDDLMSENPDIAYIKWDCNEFIRNEGSQYLANEQNMYYDYTRGLESVLQRIRNKYPDLVIQACASGGARVNYGVMPWFDEFWTSDQTSAQQRIFIQWGTSYFFPACAMGCHISASPDLHSYTPSPMKYRLDIASTGRLGVEMLPSKMTAEEREFVRKGIETYKNIRPIVQEGDLYRLVSPYENKGLASLMYVTPQKDKAVFYWFKMDNRIDVHFPRVAMAGLNPARTYKVTELNKTSKKDLPCEGKCFSGEFLMNIGLEIPNDRKDPWGSRVLMIEAQ